MHFINLFTTIAAAFTLVAATPSPFAPRSDWYQTFYASSDCSGDPIQVVQDTSSSCTHLSTTAYSVSSVGSGCCGAYIFSAANSWDCSQGIGNAKWIVGDVTCTSYPDGLKEVLPACC